MSRPVVIRPVEIAEAISNSLMAFAREIEAMLAAPLRTATRDMHMRELMTMFESSEASQLLRLVGEMRIRCTSCNRGFSYTRASGSTCLGCAAQAKAMRDQ